jgi:predicted nucleic acid-binding protein
MNNQRKLLDATVPIFAATTTHPLRPACAWVMTEVANGQLDVAIDTEAIHEIIGRYSNIARWEIAISLAESVLDLVPTVYPVLAADMRHAIELLHPYGPLGASARVLLHAAVMQQNGLTHIISTDDGYDHIAGIIRLDPAELFRHVPPVA